MKVPIEVSARHIHLSEKDYQVLFGAEKLENLRNLSQPGQFAAKQAVEVIGPKNSYPVVRIIGPFRNETQLEISITDAYFLGINPPPVLVSGNLKKSVGGLMLKGAKGEINLQKGVIVAKRHLHISPKEASDFNLKHLAEIKIKINGNRGLIFENVVVRSRKGIDKLSFQIDTDEANAAGLKTGDMGKIINF